MSVLSAITWEVNPIVIFTIRWYGVLFASAFIVGFYLMTWVYKREGRAVGDLDKLLIYVVAGTIIGARLGHCIFYEPHLYFSHPSQWLDVIKIWQGGLASHGGALGLYIGIFLFSRSRSDQPYLWCLDHLSLPVVLAGSFIRLGNLFNSEIVGRESNGPWAFVFKLAGELKDPAERLKPRHPAQLYESMCYILIFGILMILYRKGQGKRAGFLHGTFLVGVFVARFLVEFVKRRQTHFTENLPISMGQLLSIPFVAVGVWLILRAVKRPLDSVD